MIAGILPFVDDKKKRSYLIEEAVRTHEVSVNTVKNYLISYLTYQNIMVLAPKERMKEKELTQDEKNMRWALNKYYYTKAKQSISTAYTLMLKEKLPVHPSIPIFLSKKPEDADILYFKKWIERLPKK